MKKEILIITLTIFLMGFISAAVLNVDNTVACSDITGTPYCTIQEAIDDASSGDTINVSAGTYSPTISLRSECGNEPASICLYKNLILRGNLGNSSVGPGVNAPVLNGSGLGDGSAIALQRNGTLISNVIIEGFEIKNYANPVGQGGVGSAIISWDTTTSNITIQDNYLHDVGWNGVLVGSDDGTIQSNWKIQRNIIADAAYAGVEFTNVVNSKILNNTINVSNGNWDAGDSGVGIEVAVRDHGTGVTAGTNVTVDSNTLNKGSLGRAGINILSRAYVDPASAVLQNVTVKNNTVKGASRGIYVTSESRLDGDSTISGLLITKNTLDGNNDSIVLNDFLNTGSTTPTHSAISILNNNIINSLGPSSGIHLNPGTSGGGVEIHSNYIVNNTANGLNHEGTNTLNATYNYWGSCDGPSGTGFPGSGDKIANTTANVLFNPWTGICKINVSCAYESNNITLSANVTSLLNLSNVWFSYTINGTNFNKTATINETNETNYSATILSSELVGGQNITWNVYANDSSGFEFHDGWKTFYVRNATYLGVVPWPWDGLNSSGEGYGWWITEPTFTLMKDSNGSNIYYQWDSDDIFLYSGAFDLDDIPNSPPKESAGTLELNWWTDFGFCGNETVQSQIFLVDLTNPLIKNLQPADGATVFNNLRPTINAYLDEVFQSNSGINKSSVAIKLDGVVIPNRTVTSSGDLDAIVSFTPGFNLSNGSHQIYVNVTDNAGRFSQRTWNFQINTTAVFNMTIDSPKNETYGTRRIPFNISLSGEAEKIEYINYNDRIPRWRILCRNCDEYGFSGRQKNKTLLEGENLIGIRATDSFDQINEKNVSLFIDSKEPKILRTEPKRNRVTNGSDFSIKYTEENVKEVLLSWNPTINLTNQCNESGANVICNVQIDLTAFDGEFIDYWFNMTDIANNTDSSKPIKVLVDTTSPVLTVNAPQNITQKTTNSTYGRKVPFNLSVSEEVTLEFIDNSDAGPRWERICSNCDSYGVDRLRTKSFGVGTHDLIIRATDRAGNSDSEAVGFDVA